MNLGIPIFSRNYKILRILLVISPRYWIYWFYNCLIFVLISASFNSCICSSLIRDEPHVFNNTIWYLYCVSFNGKINCRFMNYLTFGKQKIHVNQTVSNHNIIFCAYFNSRATSIDCTMINVCQYKCSHIVKLSYDKFKFSEMSTSHCWISYVRDALGIGFFRCT